jgi:hypothetical protein
LHENFEVLGHVDRIHTKVIITTEKPVMTIKLTYPLPKEKNREKNIPTIYFVVATLTTCPNENKRKYCAPSKGDDRDSQSNSRVMMG